MPLFFTSRPRKVGHVPDLLILSSLTIDENRQWYGKLKEHGARMIEPPFRDCLKSKALPYLTIPADSFDYSLGSPVHDMYIPVLKWWVKRDFYENHALGEKTKDGYIKLDSSIRHHLIKLIEYEERDEDGDPIPGRGAVDRNSSFLEINNLNRLLEKFDLGRRSDLNILLPVAPYSRVKSMRMSGAEKRRRDEEDRFAEETRAEQVAQSIQAEKPTKPNPDVPVFLDRPWLKGI